MNDDSVVSPPGSAGPVLGDPATPASRWSRWNSPLWYGIALGVFIVGSIVTIGFWVKTDTVALVPGSARDTEDLVELGEDVEAFPSDGEILLTTVRLRQPLSVWEQLWLGLDDDNRLVHRDVVFGDRTSEENTEINLQLMADSKQVAVAVALEELGYEAITSNGVVITSVQEGSAADGVVQPGEIVVAVDDTPTMMSADLVDAVGGIEPGTTIVLTVLALDDGEQDRRTVTVGAREDDPERAFLGVGLADNLAFADVGFDVAIDTGEVGGPSAGLAFTLAVLDQLTAGELTGGADVAVTGTMRPDGSVGAIGGLPQKAAAVRDEGLDTFIVPAAQSEADLALAEELVDGKVRIVPVENLEQALDALAELGGDVAAIDSFAAANPAAGS